MKALKIVGCVLAGLEFVLSAVALYLAISTGILTLKYTVILGLILFLLPILFIIMQRNNVTSVIAIVLSAILCAALLYGTDLLHKTNSTLNDITADRAEVEQINVYVQKEDEVSSINEAVQKKYPFGVVDNGDTSGTDEVIQKIRDDTGSDLTLTSYKTVYDAVKALENGEIKGIIANEGIISALDASEGYTDYSAQNLRIILEDEVKMEAEEEPKTSIDDERFCIYFSGIDTFGSVNVKSRSDVNVIGVVNVKTHQIALISTPRDYYIPLSVSKGNKDKLTHAGIYGIDCSVNTLGMLYDASIDRYLRVNFTGFQEIVDELGGIDVYSDASFTSDADDDKPSFTKGMNHMDGKTALAFVRDRHDFADGDFARGRHQMEVIRAVISKMQSSEMLENYSDVMDSLADCFQTNMTKDEIGALVQNQLSEQADWNILTYSVTGVCATEPCWSLGTSASVVIPNDDDVSYAKELIQGCLKDQTYTQDEVDQHATKTGELHMDDDTETGTEVPVDQLSPDGSDTGE